MNLFLILLVVATLPGFEDFRRIDGMRRLTRQLHTAELLNVSQIDADLILRTAERNAGDGKLLWGAAELLVDWPRRRALFEAAVRATDTNIAAATRFACAAAKQGDTDIAQTWLRYCQQKDSDNTVPWLAELWMLREQKKPTVLSNSPPIWATNFRDYSVDAIRARIRLLEAAGYSPYAARRLGFQPDSIALTMTRDLCKPPVGEQTAALLKEAAQSLQLSRRFLLGEFIGQTIERTLMKLRPDADTDVEMRYRSVELDKRREELKELLAAVEHNTIDYATEAEMVRYFDDVLDNGEETAMKHLTEAVRRKADTP